MDAIEAAVDVSPAPDKVFRHLGPCSIHPDGDPARLDFRARGFSGRCDARGCKSKPVWRHAFLCSMPRPVVENFCDAHLPVNLRPVEQA